MLMCMKKAEHKEEERRGKKRRKKREEKRKKAGVKIWTRKSEKMKRKDFFFLHIKGESSMKFFIFEKKFEVMCSKEKKFEKLSPQFQTASFTCIFGVTASGRAAKNLILPTYIFGNIFRLFLKIFYLNTPYLHFLKPPPISLRGSVTPFVGPSVGAAFFGILKNASF